MKVELFLRQGVEHYLSESHIYRGMKLFFIQLSSPIWIPIFFLRSLFSLRGKDLWFIIPFFLMGASIFSFLKYDFWRGVKSIFFVVLFIMLMSFFGRDAQIRRRILSRARREFKSREFDANDYKLAADALESFGHSSYEYAVKKHSERVVFLLVMAGGVLVSKGKLRRQVSIRSILEDRAAKLGDQ